LVSATRQADESDAQRYEKACRWVASVRALIEKLHKQEREFSKGIGERLNIEGLDPQHISNLCEEFERCAAPRLRFVSPIRFGSPLATWRREAIDEVATPTAALPGQLELFCGKDD
jgi:hypothetical protein